MCVEYVFACVSVRVCVCVSVCKCVSVCECACLKEREKEIIFANFNDAICLRKNAKNRNLLSKKLMDVIRQLHKHEI